VVPEPVQFGAAGEKWGYYGDPMIASDAYIGALEVILRLLDNDYRHLTRETREEMLGPLPDKAPAQM
jgi:hypothetical protein